MGCGMREVRVRKAVWSNGTDGTGNTFVAFLEGNTAEASSVSVALLLEGKSAQLRAYRAITYSNDGLSWDTPTAWGSAETTANAWAYPAAWQSVDDAKRLFRVGVIGRNVSTENDNVEMATVSAIINRKPR